MKRSECTVARLKELGYKAMVNQRNNWTGYNRTDELNERQANQLFELVVKNVKEGKKIDIQRNGVTYEVIVFLESMPRDHGFLYYLTRPMTEAEKLESDMQTGRNTLFTIECKN